MTPAQLKAWQDQHSGAAGDPEPGQSGDLTYRANDGAYITVHADGTLASQGYANGPGGPTPAVATSPSQPPPAKKGVGSYTQTELEARVAQNPGLVYQGQSVRTVQRAYGMPPSQVAVVSWKDPKTGEVVEADVGDDGIYNVTKDQTPVKAPTAASTGTSGSNPRVPAGSVPRIEGTPDGKGGYDNSQPIRVWHDPNTDAVVAREPVQANDPDYIAWQRQYGPGTSAEEPVPNRPGWVQVTTAQGGNKTVKFRGPDGKVVDTLPAAPTIGKPEPDGNGNWGYWDQQPGQAPVWKPISGNTPTAAQTPVQVNGQWGVWKPGANGAAPTFSPISGVPEPGAATAGGPSMTAIMEQGAIKGLTAIHDMLWNDTSLTPEIREKRFQEAVQVANIAIEQAKTDQLERESQRNADVNVATSTAKYLQDGMQQALGFVSKLNGGTAGTTLGGQAFAAILGLQSLQLAASGLSTIPSVGTQAQRALQQIGTIPPATLNDPAALTAANQAMAQHTAAAASPPAPQQNASGGTGEPPARGNVPAQPSGPTPAAAAAPTPAPAPTALPSGRPDQTQAAGQIDNAISPPAAPDSAPAAAPIDQNPGMPGGPPARVLPQPADAAPPDPSTYTQPGTIATPDNPQDVPFNPTPGEPGHDPYMPSGRTQPSDWSALASLQPPSAPTPAAPQQPGADPSQWPALLHAQAASKPPWAFSQADYDQMKAAGVSDDVIFSIPGRSAAA